MALLYCRNVIFPLLSLLAFETNPQGHFLGTFSSRFHSFGQLPTQVNEPSNTLEQFCLALD
jgi:hypothetical protein